MLVSAQDARMASLGPGGGQGGRMEKIVFAGLVA